MPIFEYRCEACGVRYDIFHKVKEIIEDIVCPQCNSSNYKRLMSIPSISSRIKSNKETKQPSCEYANTSCCDGNCDLLK